MRGELFPRPHTDRNENDRSTPPGACYQSILYVLPATTGAQSTTVVWPGSHRDVYDTVMTDPQCPAEGQ